MNLTKILPPFVLVPLLTLMLSACGGSNGVDLDELPTFTESEFATDSKALTMATENLESIGLKFKTAAEPDQQRLLISWDEDAVKPDTEKNPNTIPYLKNYAKVGDLYIKKYASKFNLRRETGATQGSQLKDQIREEIKARITVAKKTLEAISK